MELIIELTWTNLHIMVDNAEIDMMSIFKRCKKQYNVKNHSVNSVTNGESNVNQNRVDHANLIFSSAFICLRTGFVIVCNYT